jgi:hypothetical protein
MYVETNLLSVAFSPINQLEVQKRARMWQDVAGERPTTIIPVGIMQPKIAVNPNHQRLKMKD